MTPRIRDLGYNPGQSWLQPGPLNAITDVPGVRVGTHTLKIGEYDSAKPNASIVRTGVTVIQPRPDKSVWTDPTYCSIWALNGAGEMTGAHIVNEHGVMEAPIALCGTTHVGAVHEGLLRQVVERMPEKDEQGNEIPKTNVSSLYFHYHTSLTLQCRSCLSSQKHGTTV